jgi:hypothetical protein
LRCYRPGYTTFSTHAGVAAITGFEIAKAIIATSISPAHQINLTVANPAS